MQDPTEALLRWFTASDAQPREVAVTLIGTNEAETILHCTTLIPEQTKVYLIGKNYTVTGIVNSCAQEESGFRIVIKLGKGDYLGYVGTPFDPGVLQVEEWLSEEAEDKILKDLEQGLSSRGSLSSSAFRRLRNRYFGSEKGNSARQRMRAVTSTGVFRIFAGLGLRPKKNVYLFRPPPSNGVPFWPLTLAHCQ